MYAVRKLKRNRTLNRNKKLAESLIENRSRDFFKEIKKINPKPVNDCLIDGLTNNGDIAELFAEKYKQIYNSVPSNDTNMQTIDDYIMSDIKNCSYEEAVVSTDDVINAIKLLKLDKSDGEKGYFSNHLIYAGNQYFEQLAGLLTTMLSHGYQPEVLCVATIISIPKDYQGSLSDKNNYRGIALSSCIGKLFDLIFLKRNYSELCTSELQFAFKPKLGTTMCTLLLKEVIKYYLDNYSHVYSCFIDATKAFDRVKHDELFLLLIQRHVSSIDTRILWQQYQTQKMRTSWNGSHSVYFTASNGIRQGSVASPILFCVYMDELLDRLRRAGIGCWMGDKYLGTLAYADDVTLICPSADGLQKMLNLCDEFGQQYGMAFNPKKSMCVKFTRQKSHSLPAVRLSGNLLQWVQDVKHLGNYISYNLKENYEVKMKKCDLVGRVNMFIASFGDIPENALVKLFNVQCCHFYGSQAWNFCDQSVDSFHKLYNRCVRRLLRLPYATHTRYLPAFTGTAISIESICSRFVKLYLNMRDNDNTIVRTIANFSAATSGSIIGGNLLTITKKYKCQIAPNTGYLIMKPRMSQSDQCTIQAIRDARDFKIDFLTKNERDFFINELCIH